MGAKTIAWCTGHYHTSFTKEKAKELREQGYKVKFGSYVKEGDETYCKIYLVKDFEYHILSALKSMEVRLSYKTVEAVKEEYAEKIKSLCLEYKRSAKIELDEKKIYAIVDHKGKEKELFVPINLLTKD